MNIEVIEIGLTFDEQHAVTMWHTIETLLDRGDRVILENLDGFLNITIDDSKRANE